MSGRPTRTQAEFPHVAAITDPATQRTITELWNRLTALQNMVNAQGRAQTMLAGQIGTLSTAQAATAQQVSAVYALGAAPTVPGPSPVGPTGLPSDPGQQQPSGPGIDDGGEGAAGCADQTGSGHVDPALPLDAHTAGMIVCGTGAEYASLLAPAVDQPTRDANVLTLLGRVIWHLQLAGFTAGKQMNPSGAISTDKVALVINGANVAYDIVSLVPFGTQMTMHMVPIGGANLQPDGGISD